MSKKAVAVLAVATLLGLLLLFTSCADRSPIKYKKYNSKIEANEAAGLPC